MLWENMSKVQQEKVLEDIKNFKETPHMNTKPCIHDKCPECHGTGKKEDETQCIHNIKCHCKNCNPFPYDI